MKQRVLFHWVRPVLVISFFVLSVAALACSPSGDDPSNAVFLEATISHLEAQLTPNPLISAVIITSPAVGQRFQEGDAVEVQYEAIGEQGISRVELLVDGNIVTAADFIPQPGSPFVAKAIWVPERPGSHLLRIQAFSPNNVVIQSGQVLVEIDPVALVAATNTSALRPSPTATAVVRATNTPMSIPLPWTTTPVPPPTEPPGTSTPAYPYLLVRIEPGLNVREGPSTSYRRLGSVRPGKPIRIVGQNNIGAGKWWQIEFDQGPGGVGWVSASAQYSEAFNADGVEIAAVPTTPAQPTATFTPVPAAPAPPAGIQFEVDRTQINAGECVTVYWNVTDVKEVYYRGQGVPGSNQGRRECPSLTESYELRVVMADGRVESRTIRVEVEGTRYRTSEIDIGESIDFDEDGKVSTNGDDFKWVIEEDDRRFVKWDDDGDLRLVAIGPLEMEQISEEDCRHALDTIKDRQRVTPFPGMAACIVTDEGRRGKVRFDNVTNDADIEWALWK
jgi:hypothetical protein